MLRILNLSLDDIETTSSFYNVPTHKEETLEELLTFNLGLLTPEYMTSRAKQLAEFALMCNSDPMVALKYRAVYINPPSYFAKYLENAILNVGLKPVYKVDNTFFTITEKTELPNVTIDLTEPMTFEELKEFKLEEIANARYIAETSGVNINGVVVKTDRESQALITGAALQAMVDSDYSCKWKTEQGFIELTAEQILGIAVMVRQHVQECFDKEAELTILIEAAQTIEDLNEIVWE